MKINERSRLASEKGCRKGYYRVSPFMKEAKYVPHLPTFCVCQLFLVNPVFFIGTTESAAVSITFRPFNGTLRTSSRKMWPSPWSTTDSMTGSLKDWVLPCQVRSYSTIENLKLITNNPVVPPPHNNNRWVSAWRIRLDNQQSHQILQELAGPNLQEIKGWTDGCLAGPCSIGAHHQVMGNSAKRHQRSYGIS